MGVVTDERGRRVSAATKPKPDESGSRRARDEALALIAELESELAGLAAFVAEEKRAAKRKAPAPKRLARLRLVAEDVSSAARLSRKAAKG